MDGQNFNNGFDSNHDTDNTPVAESATENATANSSESTVETVNVNTGSYQDSTSSYGNFSYQGDNSNSGNFNYQDNASQYYTTTPVYTDNYNQQGESTPGFAIASLVLGIVSILFCCCWGGGILFAVPGIIMGLSANKKQKTGVGTAGIICSIVGAVLNGIMLIWFAIMLVAEVAASM